MTSKKAWDRRSRGLGLAIVMGMAIAAAIGGCVRRPPEPEWTKSGGDPGQGAILIGRFSCGACHQIDGVVNANGKVGPPLSTFGDRTMIAGVLPNTPDNLVLWLRHPQTVVPGNAMPDVGLTEAQARDVAAYIYRKS